jgi:hypothetical protein
MAPKALMVDELKVHWASRKIMVVVASENLTGPTESVGVYEKPVVAIAPVNSAKNPGVKFKIADVLMLDIY